MEGSLIFQFVSCDLNMVKDLESVRLKGVVAQILNYFLKDF